MLRISKFFIISFIVLLSNCSTVQAPRRSVPKLKGIETDAFGGWITLSLKGSQSSIAGELIAVDTDSIFVMRSDKIHLYSKTDISTARIILYNTGSNNFLAWTILGSLATISNGGFLIITLPITLIMGITTTVAEAKRINFYDYPNISWGELNKYARFPQGITSKININDIKPRPVIMY
jgi:hypothetical protein